MKATIVRLVVVLTLMLSPAIGIAQTSASPALQITTTPLALTTHPCSDMFRTYDLDHITTTADGVIRMFEANGAGLAAGDLDNDGDLDLVLGNLHFANTILWNEGNLTFRSERMQQNNTRAITLVDVDADGWLDMVFTRGDGALNYLHNQGQGLFRQETLPGVGRLAYVINWGDLDQDHDLDLVTATYDAGLLTDRGNEYLFSGKGGVTVYTNDKGRFRPTVLATSAMGLALGLVDLDGDQRQDILVGNDFGIRDQMWQATEEGWQAIEPFARTSLSTMSVDWADIGNNGAMSIFTTDMQPYDISPPSLARWLPVIARLEENPGANDPQQMSNALNVQTRAGGWRYQSGWRGVEATGWSWSGKFGDLDNDGFLDLYVVNGMIEEKMLAYLPNHELVEENQARRNDGHGRFVAMPQWQLNSTASGRGMVMADLDQDGDLDIVVNNLRAPAQLFENQLCGGDSLQVELAWPAVQNRNAIGAVVTLLSSTGQMRRDVRAASGYLSGDSARLHFGIPAGAMLDRLVIRWPDGVISQVQSPEARQLLRIERR